MSEYAQVHGATSAIDRGVVWRHMARHVAPSLLLNGVAPYLVYAICSSHMAAMNALLLAALIPLADVVVILARHRRLDAFGACMVLSLVLSGVTVLLGGNPRWILARESMLSGAFGAIMLLSLFGAQPLVYYLAGHFVAGHAPGRLSVFRHRAASPWMRSFLRLLTVVWGLVTLGDAALNVYLAFHVSIPTFLAVAPAVRYTIMGGAFLWTMTHAHRGRYLAYLFAV